MEQTTTNSYRAPIRRKTKTIEKYGPDGEYLGKKVITIDKEDVQLPGYTIFPYTTTGTVQMDPDSSNQNWSYTSQN